MSAEDKPVVYGTEDLLISLCNSVVDVLVAATHSQIRYSAMVQRISKTCLKPDIGCFVLFVGGFSGLVDDARPPAHRGRPAANPG